MAKHIWSPAGADDFTQTRCAKDFVASRRVDLSGQRVNTLGITFLVGAIYALLWNRFWVPGSDGDFYLVIARNVVLGGLVFTGHPLTISPPGWPWILAGLLKISRSFGFLKFVVMLCMIGFFGLMYTILRRFTSPVAAAGIVVLCAINSNVYPLTFWLHSDALFGLLSAATIVLALQMSEGRQWGWRLPLLIALCVAATLVRWAGMCNAILVACALFHCRPPWPWDRQAKRLVMAGVVCILTATATGVTVRQVEQSMRSAAEAHQMPATQRVSSENPLASLAQHIVAGGRWESTLFWEPLRFVQSIRWIDRLGLSAGWFLRFCFILGTIGLVRQHGSWMFWGVAAYVLGIEFFWFSIEARYLVPLLPLIFLAVVRGLGMLASAGRMWSRVFGSMRLAFIFSIALCGLATYAIDVAVSRSSDFYGRYEAGTSRTLIDAGYFLSRQSLAPRQIAVSLIYDNLGVRRQNVYVTRVTVLLSGHDVMSLGLRSDIEPTVASSVEPGKDLRSGRLVDYLRGHGVKYYLYQEPTIPWRVGHFRLPIWLQARLAKTEANSIKESGQWQLWEIQSDSIRRIELPHVDGWPDGVPGL